ncbi:MAG: hypothetical protein ABJB32_06290 [Verrucomicrobiota bacterium]
MIAASEISGLSQRSKGVMKREVCSADIKSVEPMKITPNQTNTGSQYLKKERGIIG